MSPSRLTHDTGELLFGSARVLLVTDIFGDNPCVHGFLAGIGQKGNSRIISPYGRTVMFRSEEEAYACFLSHGGMAPYAEKLLGGLAGIGDGPLVCIGFSAGAAALWQGLASPAAEGVRLAVCLYGGQIRHALTVEPRCPCLLLFPAEEAHFSVEEVLGSLKGRENVYCATVPWRHGYMNRLSANFDQSGYERTLAWLGRLLAMRDPAADYRSALGELLGKAP